MVDVDAICRDASMELLGGRFHRCQCRNCAASLFPPVPPEGSPYVVARNGPTWAQVYRGRPAALYNIAFNGCDTNNPFLPVTEAYEGEQGWVVYHYRDYNGKVHDCICGSGYRCALVAHGLVEFSYTPVY